MYAAGGTWAKDTGTDDRDAPGPEESGGGGRGAGAGDPPCAREVLPVRSQLRHGLCNGLGLRLLPRLGWEGGARARATGVGLQARGAEASLEEGVHERERVRRSRGLPRDLSLACMSRPQRRGTSSEGFGPLQETQVRCHARVAEIRLPRGLGLDGKPGAAGQAQELRAWDWAGVGR